MDWIYMYLYVCVCALCVGVVVVVVVALRLCNILDVPDHDGQSVGDLCALVKGNEREQVNRSPNDPEWVGPVKMLINPIMFLNSECSLISKPFRRGLTNIFLKNNFVCVYLMLHNGPRSKHLRLSNLITNLLVNAFCTFSHKRVSIRVTIRTL